MPARKTSPLRRRRSNQNLFGFVLLAAAIVVSSIIFSRTGEEQVRAEIVNGTPVVGQFDTVNIPVPYEPVTAGTILHDVKFQLVAFPRHQVPKGAVFDIEPYRSSMAIAPLPANLPIFAKNLSVNPSASNPVIERIPEGMRAITVKVDATGAVEGWASSGAIVDVLLVTGEGTNVIAEKVKILSAARSVNPIQNSSSKSVPSTVTLLVSQEQALAITTATPMGKVAFALRSLGDEGRWAERRYHKDRLSGKPATSEEHRITGYARIEGATPKRFALSGGKWIPTEVEPKPLIQRGE
ncbi:MAG: Flp pilus assembly protein CpaB [Bdellovibrionales bacterium]|nr:Flp pilus assembly protein CpaB [Bdellovibrionales bacterium]